MRLPRTPPITFFVLACITCETSGRLNCIAGDSPKSTPVKIANPTLKHSTGRLMRIAASCGNENSGNSATITATVRYASMMPSAAPLSDNTSDSVSNCRMNARASGAHRRAHREFVLARRAAGQQQDGNIAAANRQQQRHRPEQQHQRRPDLLHEPLVQPLHLHPEAVRRKMLRCLLGKLLKQRLELGIDGRVGHARFQLDFDGVPSRRIRRESSAGKYTSASPQVKRGGATPTMV